MKSYNLRAKQLWVISLILFSLILNLISLKNERGLNMACIGHDKVTLYIQRFSSLRKILRGHGIVGYITDKKPEEISKDFNALQGFYLTQYALSPVIVDNSLDYDLIVGNFNGLPPGKVFIKNRDVSVYKDFGTGVFLYKTRVK